MPNGTGLPLAVCRILAAKVMADLVRVSLKHV